MLVLTNNYGVAMRGAPNQGVHPEHHETSATPLNEYVPQGADTASESGARCSGLFHGFYSVAFTDVNGMKCDME